MTHWIMIAYLYAWNGGGPVSANFGSLPACESAVVELKKAFPDRVLNAVCVPYNVAR